MKGAFWIDLGPWPPACVIVDNEIEWKRLVRKLCGTKVEPLPFPGRGCGLCQKFEDGADCVFAIAVGEQTDRIELAATLAHEAAHATRWLFDHISEKAPGQEAEAYLIEHIVRHGLKALAE